MKTYSLDLSRDQDEHCQPEARHDSAAEILAEAACLALAVRDRAIFAKVRDALARELAGLREFARDGDALPVRPSLMQEITAFYLSQHPDSIATIAARHGVTRAAADKMLMRLRRRLGDTGPRPNCTRDPAHALTKASQMRALHADRQARATQTTLTKCKL
jgi:hypothetical protein